MSEEGTQAEPQVQENAPDQGTTETGQPEAVQASAAHDPAAMQADYTRKTQQLAEERRAFEAQQQAFQQQQQQFQQYYQQAQQPQAQAQPSPDQVLEEQFGTEAARALKGLYEPKIQTLEQQLKKSQFESAYMLEAERARLKFGEDFSKQDYVDAQGAKRNHVIDAMCAMNPVTGKSLTLEQAWHAMNPVDPATLSQKAKDEAYQEMTRKEASTPAEARSTAPASTGQGHASSIEEALEQAWAETGAG